MERNGGPGSVGAAVAALAVLMAAAVIAALVMAPRAGVETAQGDDTAVHPGGGSAAAGHMTSMGVGPPPVWADGRQAVPTRHLGPQGGVGQFVAKCLYSHSAMVDPIVWPGTDDRSHLHDFYGATSIGPDSTPETLVGTKSTCDKPGDSAGYWQPTLYDHEVAVTPLQVSAYYRAAPGVEPTDVEPFPFGLALIAGDALADSPQTGEAAGWTCGVTTSLSAVPPDDCAETAPLRLVLTFPDCWDGTNLDTANHRDQATYSEDGSCPDTHPVHVPQLTVAVKFPIVGGGHDLRLASGNVYSAHGDFFNAWDPDALRREVEHCIHNGAVCDLASNREDVAPFMAQ